ncbi:MAG TPA: hypothetical protein VGM31_09830 [Puia sp.]|jgi:hypothetical protein
MEREQVVQLMEKYWEAETTVEEERMLLEYFRGGEVPSEWEPYRDIFLYYEDEKGIKPGAELEQRIMEQVQPRLRLRGAWWAAAAVIMLLLGLEPLLRSPVKAPVQRQAVAVVKDTYSDPHQALAAVQKALLVASRNMNKGLHALK